MSRVKSALLTATLIAASAGGVAWAQMRQPAGTYDPAQLPATKGKVAEYLLSPRGDVDGLLLEDGTEVHFRPYLSSQLIFAVHPGDQVTIHGLKARALPMIAAMSVTNDASGATVTDTGPREFARLEATGKIKQQLHGPRGEINGVLLDDGTIIRLPPPEAERLATQLAAGNTLYVSGDGYAGPLGRVIAARAIGPSKDQTTEIAAPRMAMHGPGMMRGMMRGMGPMHGPGEPPPPPPGGPAPQ